VVIILLFNCSSGQTIYFNSKYSEMVQKNWRLGVYQKILKVGVLNMDDIKEINSKLVINESKENKAFITLKNNVIDKIVINASDDNHKRYLLLHEIGHYVQIKGIKIGRLNIGEYGKKNDEENYAESFAQLLY